MPDGRLIPLTNECLLLKGCQLRNTGHCYGIAVYTGHQTKVMNNSLKSRSKKSKIEMQTNSYILITVCIQMCICLSSAFYDVFWTYHTGQYISYLGFSYNTTESSLVNNYVVSFMLWFIALMNFVSISLLVTLEMVKLLQGYFIENDWMLYDIEKDMHAKV